MSLFAGGILMGAMVAALGAAIADATGYMPGGGIGIVVVCSAVFLAGVGLGREG